jgi:hypothetical protein
MAGAAVVIEQVADVSECEGILSRQQAGGLRIRSAEEAEEPRDPTERHPAPILEFYEGYPKMIGVASVSGEWVLPAATAYVNTRTADALRAASLVREAET